MRRALILFMGAVLALGVRGPAAAAGDDGPVRAAMVYNFLRFATWDDEPAPTAPLTLCVDPSVPALPAFVTLNGKTIGDRRLRVVPTSNPVGHGCRVAYLGPHASNASVAQHLAAERVLTIGEGVGFSRGGVIGLVVVGRELRFEINQTQARRSGIGLSSKLLRLAVVVR